MVYLEKASKGSRGIGRGLLEVPQVLPSNAGKGCHQDTTRKDLPAFGGRIRRASFCIPPKGLCRVLRNGEGLLDVPQDLPPNAGKGCHQDTAPEDLPAFDGRTRGASCTIPSGGLQRVLRDRKGSIGCPPRSCHQMLAKGRHRDTPLKGP